MSKYDPRVLRPKLIVPESTAAPSRAKAVEDVDARIGERQAAVMGQEVRRGNKVKVTVKIVYDDGKVDPFILLKNPQAKPLRAKGHYVIVSVMSQVRPGLEKHSEVKLNQFSAEEMRRNVQVMAGACAEMLCEQYNDRIDPSECAKAASEAWTDTMKAVENLPG